MREGTLRVWRAAESTVISSETRAVSPLSLQEEVKICTHSPRKALPFWAQGRGAASPEVLPRRSTGSGVGQGGVLYPVRQLKLGAWVTPAATPPGPTDTAAAPAPSLLGRAMGTRDDEYDYLFKGEAMGSPTLHRLSSRSPDTPGGPA